MFAVLEIEEYKKGFIRRLQRMFEKDDVTLKYCTVQSAVPFIEVKAAEGKDGVNWNEVKNAAGVCAERMILPVETEVPDGYGVKRFAPTIYKCIPLFNSMVELMKTLDLTRNDLNITVLDKNGALCERIDELIRFARHVTVMTNSVSEYREASKRAMENYGAAVVINDYDHQIINDSVVYADEYDDRLSDCSVVFCADDNCENKNVVTGSGIIADGYILDKKPKDIETFDFVAALYELNNYRRAEEYLYAGMKLSGSEVSNEEIGAMIEKTLFKDEN